MEIVIGIVVGAVLGAVGFVVGRGGGRAAGAAEGRAEAEARLQAVADAVAAGRVPEAGAAGSPERALSDALASGWAPRDAERREALNEALSRVAAFLATRVRAPLTGFGNRAGGRELRERISRAVGALEDLDFYLEEPATEREGRDLVPLIQHVAKEFAADHNVGLRLQLEGGSVRASVNTQVLLDSLYLILHNAARFGGGNSVDVVLETVGDRSVISVRDRGEGFSEEAFKRAFDPFYSTSDEGLGLGLPHARTLIEGMGGNIELSNVPGGGAQVDVSFPSA